MSHRDYTGAKPGLPRQVPSATIEESETAGFWKDVMFMLPLLIIVIAVIGYIIMVYNGLQGTKTRITASIQEIGNQLKRQASLIPNLESAVKAYMGQEKDIFKMLTDARTSITKAEGSNSVRDIDQAIDKMQALLPKMNILVESNPEIKSNETVGRFMSELTDTADKMSYARRALIDLTQSFNQRLVTFPSNLVAQLFGFKPEAGLSTPTSGTHLSVSEDEMKDVQVKL